MALIPMDVAHERDRASGVAMRSHLRALPLVAGAGER
jgi:hypothetical protein